MTQRGCACRGMEWTFTATGALHAWIEEYLEHRELPADPLRFRDPVTQRHIESLAPVLPRIGTVAALESAVYHPDLQYCGKEHLYAFNKSSLFVFKVHPPGPVGSLKILSNSLLFSKANLYFFYMFTLFFLFIH